MAVEGDRRPDALTHVMPLAIAWVAIVGIAVAIAGGGLGNDEAQYALGARGLVGEAHDSYPLFRSIGMCVLALPGVLAGGSELAIRLPFVLIAVAYVALVWKLAKRTGAPDIAVAVQASAAPWLARTGEALSDIPAAALLLAMIVLLLDDRRRAWIGAAAAGAAAFYVRYGSAPVIALVLAVVFVAFPARRRATLLAAGGVVLAIAPFFVWSEARTGSLVGVLRVSEAAANRTYVGEGLWFYVSRWFLDVAWPLMGAIAVLGIAAARDRLRVALVVVALGQIVLLGLTAHGEPRYVFLALTLLTICGARQHRAILAVAALSAVVGAGFAIARADRMAHRRAALVSACAAIRADAHGASCIVYTGTQPQVAWYSRCKTQLIGPDPAPVDAARGYARVYLVSAQGSPRQPESGAAVSAPSLEFRPLTSGTSPDWFVWRAR